ncbi:polypeptide N-acetylgalactosaminyltransferase 10 isoform X2 [Paroedura picta]|uniref:polypeptide N-acetylgalactosaminyltransferase 10 isoform X2 n=1 Tax=Paroedura picta TaxID=143630 RepID=UPI00405712A4
MRRKQKRLLQVVGLALAALVFLPNVGLWSFYRERQLDGGIEKEGGGGAGGARGMAAPAGVVAAARGEAQGFHTQKKEDIHLDYGQRRKDWHDRDAIRRDLERTGNGEQGKPYLMSDAERVDQAYRENGFNIFVSDKISLNRSLPDIRHPNCNKKLYHEKLPNTSVIIPFHNEGWSSLLRTVHSVLNRSPSELIAEIVLVDDFSDRDRIARNRKAIVCPMIDVIDHDHFGYETQAGDAMRGAFDWEMYYKRIPIPPELQKSDPSDSFESPVMAGGLFAVDRKWFWELGGYDAGLEIWGGEQYEISFKVWMCGGRMEDIPCSRVGHIYRKYVPYKVPTGVSLARNLKRVAEVWMDEYAEYIYQRRPEYRHLSAGDVTAQKELRNNLNCKSFKWFMSEVAWDLPKFYPPVEPPAAAWGEIRNVGTGLCADTKYGALGSPLRIETCVKGRGEAAWNNVQVFTFSWREDIRPGDPQHTKKFCFDAISHNSPVTLYDCHGMKGNQLWKYRKDKTLYHPVSGSCMDCSESDRKIFMNTCSPSSPTQQWIFEHTNSTVLENFNKNLDL